jgi:hypothetical protein
MQATASLVSSRILIPPLYCCSVCNKVFIAKTYITDSGLLCSDENFPEKIKSENFPENFPFFYKDS